MLYIRYTYSVHLCCHLIERGEIMDISQNIKKYRKSKNLTQKDLADYLNVVPTTISAWELGRNKPLMDKVTLMADLFGVSTSDIVGDTFTEENINHIFSQLDDKRQKRVLIFAKSELESQNSKVVTYPKDSNEIDTLAAHRVDENHISSPEEIEELEDFLDNLIDKENGKHKD